MQVQYRDYAYVTPEGRKGKLSMLLWVAFGHSAQEIFRLSQTSACADTMMRIARDSVLDDRHGIIQMAFTAEGGFDLADGSRGAYRYWDYKFRPNLRRMGYEGDGYGLDVDIADQNGHVVYWKPKVMTIAQVQAVEGTIREFISRLQAYDSMLTSGLKMLQGTGRFDRCEDIINELARQYGGGTNRMGNFLFRLENFGSPYKPRQW